jgi:hypothetical protein
MDVWIRYDVTEISNRAIFSEDTSKAKLNFIKDYKYIN